MLRSRSFTLGFLVGLLLFAAANIYTFYHRSSIVIGFYSHKEFGWPFRLHRSSFGPIFQIPDEILWKGLVTDILIAVCVSAGIGLVFFLLPGSEAKKASE